MDLKQVFTDLGGTFIASPDEIRSSLKNIRAIVFDWDGVFNNGEKTGDSGSPFSEIDSMGINLLRFSFWLKDGRIPHLFVITGMNNQAAINFSKREHLDGVFLNVKNKKLALDIICETVNITPDEAAFIYDDVIDLAVAKKCRLSFFVKNRSNPLLINYISNNKISEYISALPGDCHAVREICELIIGLNGNYDQCVELRTGFTGEYETYLNARNETVTKTVSY